MIYSTETLAEAASALDNDDATYELPDGAILRLRIEPDYGTEIEEYEDCYGRLSWGEQYVTTGRNRRPSDFDGNAEKIDTREGPIWWQPPADVKRTDEHFAALRQSVRDALEYGWCGYVVELCEGSDAYDRPIVRGVASLWGIEAWATEIDAEIVSDLIHEVISEAMPDLGETA